MVPDRARMWAFSGLPRRSVIPSRNPSLIIHSSRIPERAVRYPYMVERKKTTNEKLNQKLRRIKRENKVPPKEWESSHYMEEGQMPRVSVARIFTNPVKPRVRWLIKRYLLGGLQTNSARGETTTTLAGFKVVLYFQPL
ncbi:hypothetical protein CHARACLAT_008308 [Characodon lateralis]|uniref:Uncharacterized protein n=1 Tax=Characodon lateralis TaxID=208331 RepID=A0ABU7CNL6_9TELE|nr:hypothetical protein [Characodon lateralis]